MQRTKPRKGVKVISFEVTESVHHRVKLRALMDGITVGALMAGFIEKDVYRAEGEIPPPELAEVGRKPRGRPPNADRA